MNPDYGLGPPGKERPGGYQAAEPNQQVSRDTTTAANNNRFGRQPTYDGLAGNARRHNAKGRMKPLSPCGCIRDPDVDRHRCGGEISDHMAESAVAAIAHLDSLGTPGLLNERTCRALWRIGRRDLAIAVHRRTAGAR